MKIINKNLLSTKELKVIENERNILEIVSKFDNIVKFYKYYEDDSNIYYILEYIDGVDLYEYS